MLWPYILRYRLRVFLAIVALLTAAGATLAVPQAVRRMIDHGFVGDDITFVNQYFAMMIVVVLVLALASACRYYLVTWLGERVVADLRADVFERVVGLGADFFDRTRSGEVVSRLTADTTQIKSAVGASVSIALRNLVLGFGAVVLMVVTSPELSALALIVLPLIVVPLIVFGRAVRRRQRRAQDTLADASAYAAESIDAVRTLQAFTNEALAAGRFRAAVGEAFEAARVSIAARALLTGVALFLVFTSIVAVLWYGAREVLAENMSPGMLGQFLLYAVFAGSALGQLSEVWGEVQQAAGAAERLAELMTEAPSVAAPAKPVPMPVPPRGELQFRNVYFTYPGGSEERALRDVSFSVSPGERVAVVGPSGAGKSTLVHLILRAYDPDGGKVVIDGVKLSDADPGEVRRRIGVVPQDTAIFATSIAENIRYGRPDATDEALREAAKAAHAEEFISRLPEGYNTLVGERGVTLSGGQRQRIAIARAILKDAPILLLDEATSALDAESETLVQEALEHLMTGRTTLVVAHRLATVQSANRILVLENGRIVEEGAHGALIARDGLYARLARLQFESSGTGSGQASHEGATAAAASANARSA